MPFSATIHATSATVLQVDVWGHVLDAAAAELRALIVDAIRTKQPNTLVINLHHTTALGLAGTNALLAGYIAAIDCGTSYRVQHARGPVRDVLQATGTLDVLADSNDLGALLLAVLTAPVTPV
jgi:anti-anti-sigma regulatory factor